MLVLGYLSELKASKLFPVTSSWNKFTLYSKLVGEDMGSAELKTKAELWQKGGSFDRRGKQLEACEQQCCKGQGCRLFKLEVVPLMLPTARDTLGASALMATSIAHSIKFVYMGQSCSSETLLSVSAGVAQSWDQLTLLQHIVGRQPLSPISSNFSCAQGEGRLGTEEWFLVTQRVESFHF